MKKRVRVVKLTLGALFSLALIILGAPIKKAKADKFTTDLYQIDFKTNAANSQYATNIRELYQTIERRYIYGSVVIPNTDKSGFFYFPYIIQSGNNLVYYETVYYSRDYDEGNTGNTTLQFRFGDTDGALNAIENPGLLFTFREYDNATQVATTRNESIIFYTSWLQVNKDYFLGLWNTFSCATITNVSASMEMNFLGLKSIAENYIMTDAERIRYDEGYRDGVDYQTMLIQAQPNNYGLYDRYQYQQYGIEKENEGYTQGLQDGATDGATLPTTTRILSSVFNAAANIFNIELFPNITLGLVVGIPILLGLFLVIIKFIRG